MEKSSENTEEGVWAAFREIGIFIKEVSEQIKGAREENKEVREENKKAREENKEAREEYKKAREEYKEIRALLREVSELQKETDRLQKDSIADYDRRMKKQDETIGSWSNNHGTFAEQHFKGFAKSRDLQREFSLFWSAPNISGSRKPCLYPRIGTGMYRQWHRYNQTVRRFSDYQGRASKSALNEE